MQKDIDKVVKIKPKHVFSIMFIPVRPSKATTDLIVVDKEIITEGDIKQDSIIITKKLFRHKKIKLQKEIFIKNKSYKIFTN